MGNSSSNTAKASPAPSSSFVDEDLSSHPDSTELGDFGFKLSYLNSKDCKIMYYENEVAIQNYMKAAKDPELKEDYKKYLEGILHEKQLVLDACILKQFYKNGDRVEVKMKDAEDDDLDPLADRPEDAEEFAPDAVNKVEDCFPSIYRLEALSTAHLMLKSPEQTNTLREMLKCWRKNEQKFPPTLQLFSSVFEKMPNATAQETFPKYYALVNKYSKFPTTATPTEKLAACNKECAKEKEMWSNCIQKLGIQDTLETEGVTPSVSSLSMNCYIAMRKYSTCRRSVLCPDKILECTKSAQSAAAGAATPEQQQQVLASQFTKCLKSSLVRDCEKQFLSTPSTPTIQKPTTNSQ